MYQTFLEAPTWNKIFVASLVLVVIVLLLDMTRDRVEGFATSPTFEVHRGDDIYDSLYVSLYDDLVHCKEKDNFEIDAFLNATRPQANTSRILDVGSGTGRHVGALAKKGYSVIGIDKSEAMVKEASKNYPECQFKHDDAMTPMAFPHGSFTHITCFHFTVYYFKNKRDFFKNCYDWLAPGGYLLVHLVNRAEFIPVITAANPFTIFAAKHVSGDRITQTKVTLDDYKYRSNFEYDANEGNTTLTEELINTNTGAVRKNEHTLYMPKQKEILEEASSVGFKRHARFHMSECHYDTHYLYVLWK